MEKEATIPLSSTSPHSSKRPRSFTRSSSPEKKRRLSCNDRTILEILQDGEARDTVENDKTVLKTYLEQADFSVEDVAKEKTRRTEFKDTVLDSKQTTIEMDKLLHHCNLWQKKLAYWSHELAQKVNKMECQEVTNVLKDLVTKVEVKTLQDQFKTNEMELHWAIWLQNDAFDCLKELHKESEDTDVFEAMEKQLMNDRVVELETQLTQKRAVEKEKEMELTLLRADQKQFMQSSGNDERMKTVVAGKEATDAELVQLKEEMKQQMTVLPQVEEERADWKRHNQKLVEEVRKLHEEQETRELRAMQQNVKQEKEIKKLHAMLQVAKTKEAKTTAVLEMAEQMMDKSKQRKEELKILYAKFSSTMDFVSEKTMRLEELERELKDYHAIRNQNEQLEKQVAQLQQEKVELSAARHRDKYDMREEMAMLKKQLTESNELASQQMGLASKLQSKITVLKSQNEALRKQQVKQVKQEHQNVGEPSKECDKQNTYIDNKLVAQVAEKEALQTFLLQYHGAAEEKCSRLLEKASELELQFKRTKEQTKESCSVLRMCAQVDACDESVRASLLDVMATLESLT